MCACCVLWCCIICPKCGKILGAGLAWLSAAPPPSFLKFVDKLKISGAHSAVNIRQTQPDTLNIQHHTVYRLHQNVHPRYFLFFLAAANCRSRCTISLAFLQPKYTAASGKCPKKEAWKLFSEMLKWNSDCYGGSWCERRRLLLVIFQRNVICACLSGHHHPLALNTI